MTLVDIETCLETRNCTVHSVRHELHRMVHSVRHELHRVLPNLQTVLGTFSVGLSSLYHWIAIEPLKRLYRNGPGLKYVGFWRGASSPDICAALTNVEARFWAAHLDECESLIDDDFMSYIVLFETIVYFYLLFRLGKSLLSLLCSATRTALRRRGIVERYTPEMLDWLHAKFPSTLAHYDDGGQERRRVLQDMRSDEQNDSPYSKVAESTHKTRARAPRDDVSQ